MLVRLGLWASGFALGVGTVLMARNAPEGSFGGQSTIASAALLVTGWLMIAVGLLTWRRRPDSRFGVLLAAAGLAWFVAEWNNPGAGSAWVFTFGLVLYAVCPPLVAHAAMSYPAGRLGSRMERVTLAGAYAVTLVVIGLLPALVFAPAEAGCAQCSSNLLSIVSKPDLMASLNRAGVRLGVLWAVVLVALTAWSLVSATPAARRIKAPVLAPTVAYLTMVIAGYAHAVDRGFLSNDPFERRLWIAEAVTLTFATVGVTAEWFRTRRARAAIAGLVVELGETPVPGGLRDALARELDDPTLELAYPIGEGRHVDQRGDPITLEYPTGRATTALVHDGGTIAVLIHRSDLLGDPRRVEEVASAARLAFENERLHAQVQAQLVELHSSSARLVAASDVERRHLERDLHDGAQQRLVGLSLALRLVRGQVDPEMSPTVADRVADAEVELRRAVDELRQLASGIHPAVLSDLGLVAAIESLAEGGTARVDVLAAPDQRLPSAVETTAYLVVAEAVKVGAVLVSAVLSGGRLVMDVDAVGAPAGLVDLKDRIGALDGTLTIEPTASGGIRIRIEIPCA